MYKPLPHFPSHRYRRWVFVALLLTGLPFGGKAQLASALPALEGKGYFLILVYPPSLALNTESPAAMLRSTLRIELRRLMTPSRRVAFEEEDGTPGTLRSPYFSTIGHTIVCLYCPDDRGGYTETWASLSAHDFAGRGLRRLVRDGRGLGILLDPYPEAYLPGNVENPLRLLHYRGWRPGGRIAPRYLAIPVAREDCASALAMVRAYREAASEGFPSPRDADPRRGLVFSSMLDPYEHYLRRASDGSGVLGGGCAPFGIALLKAAGVFHPRMDTLWNLVLDLPEDLIGEEGRRVPAWRLLAGRRSQSWSRAPGESRRLDQADPQRIWDWIGASAAEVAGSLTGLHVQPGPVLRIMDPLPANRRRGARPGTIREVTGVILYSSDE